MSFPRAISGNPFYGWPLREIYGRLRMILFSRNAYFFSAATNNPVPVVFVELKSIHIKINENQSVNR